MKTYLVFVKEEDYKDCDYIALIDPTVEGMESYGQFPITTGTYGFAVPDNVDLEKLQVRVRLTKEGEQSWMATNNE